MGAAGSETSDAHIMFILSCVATSCFMEMLSWHWSRVHRHRTRCCGMCFAHIDCEHIAAACLSCTSVVKCFCDVTFVDMDIEHVAAAFVSCTSLSKLLLWHGHFKCPDLAGAIQVGLQYLYHSIVQLYSIDTGR